MEKNINKNRTHKILSVKDKRRKNKSRNKLEKGKNNNGRSTLLFLLVIEIWKKYITPNLLMIKKVWEINVNNRILSIDEKWKIIKNQVGEFQIYFVAGPISVFPPLLLSLIVSEESDIYYDIHICLLLNSFITFSISYFALFKERRFNIYELIEIFLKQEIKETNKRKRKEPDRNKFGIKWSLQFIFSILCFFVIDFNCIGRDKYKMSALWYLIVFISVRIWYYFKYDKLLSSPEI